MKPKLLCRGAEAVIFLDKNKKQIVKNRIKKSYRIKELDEAIRKRRTKLETKLLTKASGIINCPLPKKEKERHLIKMPLVEGKKLSEHLDNLPSKKQKEICGEVGKNVAKLHDAGIIHGDLTTSNMILVEECKKAKIYFIDFGLGFESQKIEDKAVDIHLLKQALEAKHYSRWKELFMEFEKGYKKSKNYKKVMEQLKKVEKRGRYKG